MNKYQCHKIVEAFKITSIESVVDGWILGNLEEHTFVRVTSHWMAKNQAEINGYFVHYLDGYTSYSPREAFESGYTKL